MDNQLIIHNKMKNFFYCQFSGNKSRKYLKLNYIDPIWDRSKSKKELKNYNVENESKFVKEVYERIPHFHFLNQFDGKFWEKYEMPNEEFIRKMNITFENIYQSESVYKMASIFYEILNVFQLLNLNPEVLPNTSDSKVYSLLQTPLEKIFLDFE
jgi:hypothetical protein